MKHILQNLKHIIFCGALLIAQQHLKSSFDKSSRLYKKLMKQCEQQLKITLPELPISIQQLALMTPDELLSQHRTNLKKYVVNKLLAISKLKKQNNINQILLTMGLLGCGTLLLPDVFILATFGYVFLYEYYLFDRMLAIKFGTQLPLSYNFKQMSYLFQVCCSVGLLFGTAGKGITKLRQLGNKNITIRKQ